MTTTPAATTTRHSGERGSAAVELVLVTPLLVLFLLFVVLCGRLVAAKGEVDAAARDAARAASDRRSVPSAIAAANDTAAATLGGGRVSCRGLSVGVDAAAFRPGGAVAVEVACTVDLADLAMLGLPGSQTLHGSYTVPLDLYRGTR